MKAWMVRLAAVGALCGCSDTSTSGGPPQGEVRTSEDEARLAEMRVEGGDALLDGASLADVILSDNHEPDLRDAHVSLADSGADAAHVTDKDADEVLDGAHGGSDVVEGLDGVSGPLDVSDTQDDVSEQPQDAGEGVDAGTPLPGDVTSMVDVQSAPDVDDASGLSDVTEDATPPSDVTDTMGVDGVPDAASPPDALDTSAGPGEDANSPDAEVSPPAPLFLLSINNATHTLEKIDVETGAGTDVCQLNTLTGYPSLTFSRDNVLFASRGGTALDVIDPCTCQITPVASYGGYSGVNGITSDQGLNLFGVASTQDEFITISTSVGLAQSVGPLGVNFGSAGATWSEDEQTVYAINASTDSLYEIDPGTGAASVIAPLSLPFGTVGIEIHPGNGVLYACSSDAVLLEIDTLTGEVSPIGHTGQEGNCTNLAAPWKVVPCLE